MNDQEPHLRHLDSAKRIGRRDLIAGMAGSALAATLGSLNGCGTGSGSGGGSVNGSGNPGDPVSPAQRAAALLAVNDRMTELYAAGTLTEQSAIDYLKTRAEFSKIGSVRPGSVWAHFTDGQPLAIDFSMDPELTRAAYDFRPEFVSRAPNTELPLKDQARILNALGTAYSPPHADIRNWVVKHSYTAVGGDATVDALRSVSDDGLFYINTHGCYVKLDDGTDIWALWTMDKVSDALDITHDAMIQSGAIVRYSAIHDRAFFGGDPNNPRGNFETHYAITARFVQQQNWQFGESSLVFMNCCWSGDGEFQNECLNRGASAYGGWSNAVAPPGAWRCARFLIDRLLGQVHGSHKEYPEADGNPQRSFDASALMSDLRSRNWHKTQHPKYGEAEFSLFAQPGKGDFALLAPSLEYMDIDEYQGQLVLHGLFGSDLPQYAHFVSCGGRDLDIIEWKKNKIKCILEPDDYGDVQVRVGIRKSNTRRITRWDISIDYKIRLAGMPELGVNGTVPLRFRADVGEYRKSPGGAPVNPKRYAVITKGSDAVLTASGTNQGDCTTTWSRQITYKGGDYQNAPAALMIGRMIIDPYTKSGKLGIAFGAKSNNEMFLQHIVCPENSPPDTYIAPSFGIMDGQYNFPDPMGVQPDVPLPGMEILFANDFTIGPRSFVIGGGYITFSFVNAPAKAPPDVNAARSAKQ